MGRLIGVGTTDLSVGESFQHLADTLHSNPVSLQPGKPPLPGPPAVAIPDDGHVARDVRLALLTPFLVNWDFRSPIHLRTDLGLDATQYL